jgi:hypothetical protein
LGAHPELVRRELPPRSPAGLQVLRLKNFFVGGNAARLYRYLGRIPDHSEKPTQNRIRTKPRAKTETAKFLLFLQPC